MRTLIVLLILLAGLAVAGDFGARWYAQDAAAKAMRNTANLGANPSVDFKGFPFLLQVADGKYDDVVVTANKVGTAQYGLVDVTANMHGVEVPLSDLRSRVLHKVHVDRLDASATFDAATPLALLEVAGLLPFGLVPTGIDFKDGRVIVTGSGSNMLVDIDSLKGVPAN